MQVRRAQDDDTPQLCGLLNEIIRIGGTTALEQPLTTQQFKDYFLEGPNHICCFVAEEESGSLLGFQALTKNVKLPKDCADIATYARQKPRKRGVGKALFGATRSFATENGFTSINATIRSDNRSGIAYYAKMGFKDHAIDEGVPLQDGTPVDRVSKRYALQEPD